MDNQFQRLMEREKDVLCNTYSRYPIWVASAKGSKLYDNQGREYTDFLSGISVCSLGHCPDQLSEVIEKQAKKLVHVSNLFYQEEQIQLAERLLSSCGLDKAFFCNSGAEANEAAIKMTRKYKQVAQKNNAYEIITLKGSFHGRTLATLAATGQEKIQHGFEPKTPGFTQIELGDPQALKEAINPKTAGVMLEVVQGEGGIRPLGKEYLLHVQEICRTRDLIFIIDEIQSGMGRTGKFWAHQHYGLDPDIITTAKALANGLPIGALLAKEKIAASFDPGSHATTFGGGALLSAVACKVLEIMSAPGFLEKVQKKGQLAMELFQELQKEFPEHILEVRGLGLMLGIELHGNGKAVWQNLLNSGYVCNLTQEKILRLLPPLIISEQEIKDFVACLRNTLQKIRGAK